MWRRFIIGGVVAGSTGFGIVWIFVWYPHSAAIAEVQQLQAKMADPNIKDADRQTLRDQMRTKMEALSPDARRQVFEVGREAMEKRFETHVNQLLAMAPAERNKALDADIDQMDKRAAEFAKRQQANTSSQKGDVKKGNRPTAITDDQKISRLRSRLDRGTPQTRQCVLNIRGSSTIAASSAACRRFNKDCHASDGN